MACQVVVLVLTRRMPVSTGGDARDWPTTPEGISLARAGWKPHSVILEGEDPVEVVGTCEGCSRLLLDGDSIIENMDDGGAVCRDCARKAPATDSEES